MREILFRGKNVCDGDWIYGYYAGPAGGHNNFHEIRDNSDSVGAWLDVDPATVGQYTGLKDKNDQMIFEGDLVQPVLPPSISQPSFVWPIMPVVFSDGVFGLQDQRGGVTPFKSFAPRVTFEVKGNIHDNLELLKED